MSFAQPYKPATHQSRPVPLLLLLLQPERCSSLVLMQAYCQAARSQAELCIQPASSWIKLCCSCRLSLNDKVFGSWTKGVVCINLCSGVPVDAVVMPGKASRNLSTLAALSIRLRHLRPTVLVKKSRNSPSHLERLLHLIFVGLLRTTPVSIRRIGGDELPLGSLT